MDNGLHEFWKLAYLAQLNNSKEPLSEDRAKQATLSANHAVTALALYLEGPISSNRRAYNDD